MNWNDPAIWSALIAIVAVILSQLPPLRDLLKGRKVTINPSETFQLYHHMRNPHITFFLDIHNMGGSKVVIDRIDCVVVDENNRTWSLPAHSYISREFTDQNGNQLEFPVSRIILKPEERWNETLHFYKFWSETEEEQVNQFILDFRNDIQSQPSDEEKLIEAKAELVDQIIKFFSTNFSLHKGNFRLLIGALAEDGSLITMRGFDFTLFENHVRALKSHTDDYKYGFGIVYPQRDPMKFLWIRPRMMNDQKLAQRLYANLRK